MGVSIWYELSPYGLKIIGSPVVLQTLRRIVVLPALARPITRIRNCLNFFRISLVRSAVTWGFDEVDISKVANRCERFELSVITQPSSVHCDCHVQRRPAPFFQAVKLQV